ncbi:MAG: T9SS type A sorting domain-containing protein [Bacteroidia bacterium]|nr:T9SS type A sorting domain-containing protein [Bacteroidia bacterium]MDW8158843.1 T9SS type A sorting domain-containing protein [Bacteroidia bacterium]
MAGTNFTLGAINPILRNIHFNYNVFLRNDLGFRVEGGSLGWQIDATGNWWGGSDKLGPYETKQNTNPWNNSIGQGIQCEKNNVFYNIVAYSPWLGGSTSPDDDPYTPGVQFSKPKTWYVAELFGGSSQQSIPGLSTQGTFSTIAANNLIPRNAQNLPIGAINKAIQLAQSGDFIKVHPGVYKENIKIPAQMHLTLEAVEFKDVSPIDPLRSVNVELNSFGYYNIPEAQIDANLAGNTIQIENGAFLTINGFVINARFQNAIHCVASSASIYIKNCSFINRGTANTLIFLDFAHHQGEISIQDCFFRPGSYSSISAMLNLKGIKKGNIYQNFLDGRLYNHINNNPVFPISPLYSASAIGILLDNVANLIIKQNYIIYHTQAGIFLNASNSIQETSIIYNEIHHNNISNSPNQGGIVFFGNGANSINIANNILTNNLQSAILIQTGSVLNNLVIQKNLFHNNRIAGTTQGIGIAHFGIGKIEAIYNWWGTAMGPEIISNPVAQEGTPRLNPLQENQPLLQTSPRQQIIGTAASQVLYSPWIAGKISDQEPSTRNSPYNTPEFNGTLLPDAIPLVENDRSTYGYQPSAEKIVGVCDFFSIQIPSQFTICAGAPTQLLAIPNKGFPNPNYQYEWNGTGILNSPNSNPLSILLPSAGQYTFTLTVKDGNQCIQTVQTQVIVATSLNASIWVEQKPMQSLTLCKGSTIVLQAFPQGQQYTYNWSGSGAAYLSSLYSAAPALSLPSIENPILLQVNISDGICSGTAILQISPINNTLSATIIAPSRACAGSKIELNALAGNGAFPYRYEWQIPNYLSPLPNLSSRQLVIENLAPGNHPFSVKITDAHFCSTQATTWVHSVEGVKVKAEPQKYICENNSSTLSASIEQGNPLIVRWQAAPEAAQEFLDNPHKLTPTITPSRAGIYTYRISVTDANGCSHEDRVIVTVWERPKIEFNTSLSACVGQSIVISPKITKGTPPYTILWNTEPMWATSFFNDVSIVNPNFQTPISGIYTLQLTVTDANGCTARATTSAQVYSLPRIILEGSGVMCTQSSRQLRATLENSQKANFIWHATPEIGVTYLSSPTSASPILINPQVGNYVYSVTAIDANGCKSTASLDIAVIESNLIVNAGEDIKVCVGESRNLGVQVIGGTAQNYRWEPSQGLSNPHSASPTFSNMPIGTYTYTVSVADINGCVRQDEVKVAVRDRPSATWQSPPTNTCANSQISLKVELQGEAGFTVKYLEDAELKSFSTTNYSHTLTVQPTRNTIYTIIEISDAICTAYGISLPLPVVVQTLPTAELNGNAQLCHPNQPVKLSLRLTGRAPYTVRYQNSMNQQFALFNILESPYHFEVTPTQSGSIQYSLIEVRDASGCSSNIVSGQASITISPPPSIEFAGISSTQLVCQGEQAMFLVEISGTPPFSITYLENNQFTKTVNNITRTPFVMLVTPTRTGLHTYRIVEGKDANGCPLGESASSRTVNVLPATTAQLYAAEVNSICEGQSLQLNVIFSGIPPFWVSYQENGNQEIPLNNGEPIYTSSFAFTVRPSRGQNIYQLTSVNSLYCGNGKVNGRVEVQVRNQAPQAIFQTAEQQIFLGQSATLNVLLTGIPPWRLQYQEGSNAPITIENINGSSPFQYRFSVTPEAVGSFTYNLVSVKDASPCITGVVQEKAVVKVLPPRCPNANFPIKVVENCGSNLLQTDFMGPNYSFEWSWGNTLISKQPTVVVTQDGTYYLRISTLGCASVTSVINVKITSKPILSAEVKPATSLHSNDGSILITPSPHGNYSFELYNQQNELLQANEGGYFSSLPPNSYTIVVAPKHLPFCSTQITTQIQALPNFQLRLSNISFTSATASWNAIPNATEYELRYRVVNAPYWQIQRTRATTLVLQDLQNNTQYELQLRIFLPQPSNFVSTHFQTLAFSGTCRIPGGVYVNSSRNGVASVFWDTVPNAQYYELEYYAEGRLIGRYSQLSSPPQQISLVPGTLQQIRLRAFCHSSTGSILASRLSSPITFDVYDNSKHSNSSSSNCCVIYPNPCNGAFFLRILAEEKEEITISIINTLGKNVFELPTTLSPPEIEIAIDLRPLPKGIYFLFIQKRNTIQKHTLLVE